MRVSQNREENIHAAFSRMSRTSVLFSGVLWFERGSVFTCGPSPQNPYALQLSKDYGYDTILSDDRQVDRR